MRIANTLILLIFSTLSFGQNWVDTSYQIMTTMNLTYGVATSFAGEEDSLKMDISYPLNDTPPDCGRPLMVIVHGGAWLSGDKNEGYPLLLRRDFAKRGYVTASVNYRLGQFHTNLFINCNVPDWNCFNTTDSSEYYRANHRAIQDVHGAIRFLINHAQDYQINPNNVFVVGESAGGFVAMGVGFIDDDAEVLTNLTAAMPDVPAPNTLYENACIQNYGLAPNIANMDLSRPALGSYEGSLNLPLLNEFKIQAVGNIYGGVFNNTLESLIEDPPGLYLYHQPCDLIVPFNCSRILNGYTNCLSQFPTFCGNIVNRPFVYGSKGIKDLIDSLKINAIPTSDYYFDNSGNNYNCLQQVDPALACHAIDAYWLRTTNMATYFADQVDSCVLNSTINLKKEQESTQVAVFPNPADNVIHIHFAQPKDRVSLKVLNVLGEVIEEYDLYHSKESKLDISAWAKGLYYIQLSYNHTTEVRSIIKI